jgi:copper(I)-binding protein
MKTALVVAMLLAAAAPAAAREGGVSAIRPWSRPAAAGASGVGYLTLANRGKADALIGVDSSLARKVEMHATSMAGGMMQMRAEQRVPLPAGGEVSFAPGGRHLMFVGLKRALHPGDRLPATLHFASGAQLRVEFAVGSGGPPADGPASRRMPAMPGM